MRTHIAGVSYRPIECQVAFNELKDGDELDLVPEPDNPYDSNAIKVVKNGLHLGYIPAKLAKEISGQVDNLVAVWDTFSLFPGDDGYHLGYMAKNLLIEPKHEPA